MTDNAGQIPSGSFIPSGPLYGAEQAAELERLDRAKPYPGGEPGCPLCGAKLIRHVEVHPYPRTDSPFRVRLVCHNRECGRWTLYDW